MKETVPGIFLIESTARADEKNGLKERYALEEILSMAGRPMQHHHIRTLKELTEFVKEFYVSQYRYLHLASHGCSKGIELTYDFVPFDKLASILAPVMDRRRLFISACESTRSALAIPLFRDSTCYSVIGPRGKPSFHESAVAWGAFYTLMSKENRRVMKREKIESNLRGVCKLFGCSFNAFFRVGKSAHLKVFRG
jgi:hypothetical protein